MNVLYLNQMIPKILWQTHEWEYEDLPYPYNLNSLTWQQTNPDWDYRYVSSRERRQQVAELNPELLEFYDLEIRGMFQSDIWRYVVLNRYGGIFADLDAVCFNNLSKLDLSVDFLLPEQNSIRNWPINPKRPLQPDAVKCRKCDVQVNALYLNGFFGTSPNHRVTKGLIAELYRRYSVFDFKNQPEHNHLTDPFMFSQIVIDNSVPYFGNNKNICRGIYNITQDCVGKCEKTYRGLDVSICHGNWHKFNYKDNFEIVEFNKTKNIF